MNTLDNLPARRARLELDPIAQSDIDAVNKRLTMMRKRLKADILFIGGRLAKMRNQLAHGRWGTFIQRNFPLSIKTANIWIRAWEGRDSELALSDWDQYMRFMYGNEQKKLKARSYQLEDASDDEARDDLEQHGGASFSKGLGEETVFGDKGKPLMLSFKKVVALLSPFFDSKEYSLESKQAFRTELMKWLESRSL